MWFLLILGFVALTSAGAYLYGKQALRLPNRDLLTAWKTMLGCISLSFVFLALNLLVAFWGILALRVAVGRFISLYEVSDVTFLVLSFLQGIMFQLWRRRAW